MTIQPIDHQILLIIKDLHVRSPDLILPEIVGPMNPYGEVQSVGENVKVCRPHDKVLFLPSNAIQIEHEGQTLHLLHDSAVLAKFVDSPTVN